MSKKITWLKLKLCIADILVAVSFYFCRENCRRHASLALDTSLSVYSLTTARAYIIQTRNASLQNNSVETDSESFHLDVSYLLRHRHLY